MLDEGEFISAPGVFYPLSARVAESCGARTLYMTGYGVSASLLGKPDADILFLESPESKEEMRTIAERFPEIPKLANMVCGGETPLLSDSELKRTGIPDCDPPCLSAGGSRHGDARSHDYVLEKGVEHENVADLEDLNTLVDFPAIWALDETD